MIYLAAVVKAWQRATCPITSSLSSAHLHSTLGPEPREQPLPAETQKTERQQLRQRQRRDKQRECVIYLQSLGCRTGCCCSNILNLTGKAWCWSDSSCWCTVARRDNSYTHTETHCCLVSPQRPFKNLRYKINSGNAIKVINLCHTMMQVRL